jgi:hypothetical protein
MVAFESRAETSSGPRGFQPLREVAGHPAASDVPTGDALASPRRGSISFAANGLSARCSLRAGPAPTDRCGPSMAHSEDRPSPQPSEMASADARGWRALSASLMRLRMVVVAVAALLGTGAEAHAGQEWPHGVESAVQTHPPPRRTPMDRYIGMDVHSMSCTVCIVRPSGRQLKSDVVETNGQALVEYLRAIPRPRHLCFEEGTQSAWLHEILSPHVDELVGGGHRESRSQERREGRSGLGAGAATGSHRHDGVQSAESICAPSCFIHELRPDHARRDAHADPHQSAVSRARGPDTGAAGVQPRPSGLNGSTSFPRPTVPRPSYCGRSSTHSGSSNEMPRSN